MFLEAPRFPECVSNASGWQGGPSYQTDIVVVDSGREQRNGVWDYPLHEYDCAQAARFATEYVPLQNFFHVAGGMANGFRVKDWLDYTVTGTEGVFEMIDTTHFQLVKVYYAGVQYRGRAIQKPAAGVVVTGGSGATVDLSTGIVTVAGGTPTSWVGEFDVPCRFGTDKMVGRAVKAARELLMDWDSIPILEIRV